MRFVFINTGTKQENAGIIRCLGFGSELARLGHQVTIILSDQRENVQNYGHRSAQIDFVYTTSGLFREELRKLTALLSLKEVDVVHCMGAGTNILIPAIVAKRVFSNKILLVVDYEDKQSLLVPSSKMKWQSFLERLSFLYADAIICASRSLAEEYTASYPGKISYLPLGINHRHTNWCKVAFDLNDKDTKIRLGYLGNLISRYKDQVDFLFDVLPVARSAYNQIELHIVGNGPMRSHFENMANERGLGESVIFHGYVKDAELLPLLGSMNVLIFPFPDTPVNRFRCPHKAFLYTCTQLPIVTNPVGEVFRLLRDYPGAHFFEENNVGSFCNALVRALEENTIGDLGDFFYRYSWEFLAKRYLALCTKNLNHTGPNAR